MRLSHYPINTAKETPAEAEVLSAEVLEPDVWTHLALTYDGAHMRIYVDGALAGTRSLAGVTLASGGPLTIGCSPAEEEWFTGRIDEPRIYDRALGETEIAADMESPIQTPRSGPVAAWSFDEGEGTTAEDLTGDGHDGTIEAPATWTRGKYGDALHFGGDEGGCVTVPSSPALALGEEFTIEAWARSQDMQNEPIVFKEKEGGGSAPGRHRYRRTQRRATPRVSPPPTS